MPRRMRLEKTFLGIVLLAVTVFFPGCGGSDLERAPLDKVLLLTWDTMRPDYMSRFGYDRPTTPFLDDLLASSCTFTNAITPIPRTTQALASMFTGCYPHTTGLRTLWGRLDPGVISLAELAQGAGYSTVAVVSNAVLDPKRGLGRGFETYDYAPDTREAAETTAVVLRHLSRFDSEDRLFVWVHYIDPHVPYYPSERLAREFDPGYTGPYRLNFGEVKGGTGEHAYPEDLGKRRAVYENDLPDEVNAHIRRLYAGDIRQADDAARILMAGLEERFGRDWTVVFTSDHGESLGEHDFFYDHGDYVYEPGLRIPLSILFPRGHPLHGGRVRTQRVSLVDLAPTLKELMRLEAPPGGVFSRGGRSLVSCIEGEFAPAPPVFAECGFSFFPDAIERRKVFNIAGRFRAVTEENWKLIWTPGIEGSQAYELYDLESDPGENRNLYREDHPAAARLEAELSRWYARDPALRPEGRAPPPEITAEEERKLRSLGYVE